MRNLVRKMRGWARTCRTLGQFHWGSFPLGNEAWKREHVGGFVSKLARFPIPRSSRCIVDVGANIGTFAGAALAYCPEAIVWAVEPSSAARSGLAELVGPNPRLKLVPCALGDQPGKSTLRISKNLFSSSLVETGEQRADLLGAAAALTGESEQVTVTTLDQWADDNKINSVDLLKVDVEGFEPQVVQGGLQTLEKSVQRIIIEVSIARLGLPGAMELLKRLGALGFTLVNMDDVTRAENSDGLCTQFDAWFIRRGA